MFNLKKEVILKKKINWRNVIGAVAAIGGLLRGIAWLMDATQRAKDAKNRPDKAEELKQQNREKLDFLEKAEKIKLETYRAKKKADQEYAGTPPDEEEFKAEYTVHKMSDYCQGDEYDLRPMVGTLLPEGYDGIVYGMKNTMKSYFAFGTLIQIALGEKPQILSEEEKSGYTAPSNVYCIIADGENGGAILKDRYKTVASSLDGKLEIIETTYFGGKPKEFFEKITERCLLQPAGTSVFYCADNLKSLLGNLCESKVTLYLNHLKRMRNTLKEHGIRLTSLSVCHTEKTGDMMSGSYTLPALTPYVFRLDEGEDYDHLLLTLEFSRSEIKGQARKLVVKTDGYKRHAFESIVPATTNHSTPTSKTGSQTKKEQIQSEKEHAKQMFKDGMTATQVAAVLGKKSEQMSNWAREFEKDGVEIVRDKPGRKPKDSGETNNEPE